MHYQVFTSCQGIRGDNPATATESANALSSGGCGLNDGSVDTDGDGVGDDTDVFPSDPTETTDTDGDCTGNNAGTDNDYGVPDIVDGYPLGLVDVPSDFWAFALIEKLAIIGITKGCGGATSCPLYPVTRTQMAVFLVRTFGL